MEVKRTNLFAVYYEWLYGTLPDDICSFFWRTLAAIVFFPLVLVGRIYDETDSFWALFFKGIGTWIMFAAVVSLLVVIGYTPLEKFIKGWSEYLKIIVSLIAGIILVSTTIGIFAGIGYLGVRAAQIDKPKFVANTQHVIGAIKGEYCTKITWK